MGQQKTKKSQTRLKSRKQTFAQKKTVSKTTHSALIQGNILFNPKRERINVLEDYVIDLVNKFHTSNINVGVIPLVNNINKKYTSLVRKCQKRILANELDLSHIPFVEETQDLLWGLLKIAELRELQPKEYTKTPVLIVIDTKLISNVSQYSQVNKLLKKGPTVGLYFIVKDHTGNVFNPALFQ